jgi:DNA-binding MarR family transcriptional regulator
MPDDRSTESSGDQHVIIKRYWAKHGWGSDAEAAAYSLVAHTPRLVSQSIDRTLEPIGLTGSRYAVLLTLDCSSRGSLTIGELSRRITSHPTSATKLVDHLEAAGLVRKKVPDHDRRIVVVELTAKGRRMLHRAARLLAESKFGLGALDETQLRALTTALEILRYDIMTASDERLNR